MNIRTISLAIITAVLLLLAGCDTTQPKHNTALDDIHSALQEGHATDKKIANQQDSAQPPSAVQNALLPSLSTNNLVGDNAPTDPHFDVAVKDAPAQTFFMGLVQGTKYNMIVNPAVKGTITMNLKDVTVEQALEAVRDAYGYDFRRNSYGFEILPPGLQTRIFSVNYLDVLRSGVSQTTLTSSEGGFSAASSSGSGGSGSSAGGGSSATSGATGSVNTVSQMDFWKSLAATLKDIVGTKDGSSVVVNPEAGVVIVRAYPNDMYQVAQYLGRVQSNMQRQVIIEAKVLEVQLNKNYEAGIDWAILRHNLETPLLNPDGSTLTAVSGAFQNGTQYMTNANNMNNIVITGDHQDFNAVIQLLEQQGNVQTLSSPRVSTINNQKAVIKVGKDAFYVTNVTTTQVESGSSTTPQSSVTLEPFFSGITLDVTPQISDQDNVILQIHPAVSKVEEQNKTIELGVGGTLVLPLAESTMRETDSVVHAKNNQIIILGGLMENITSENINATPGMGRIPFFGALFRQTSQLSHKSELVVLLRPIVVDNNSWSNNLHQADNRFQGLKRGFHVGGIPEDFGTEGEKYSQ